MHGQCVCVRACVHCTHTHTHTYTHTHTHTHTPQMTAEDGGLPGARGAMRCRRLRQVYMQTNIHSHTYTHTTDDGGGSGTRGAVHRIRLRQVCRLAPASHWRLSGQKTFFLIFFLKLCFSRMPTCASIALAIIRSKNFAKKKMSLGP